MNESDVEIPGYFRDFITLTFKDQGRDWLDRIPALVAHYADRWEIEVQPPFDGLSYNYVAPATLADGRQAVLKIGVPEDEQRSEIFALRAFNGNGIARPFEFDANDQVTLIERLQPGTMLVTLFPKEDDRATEIGARLLNELVIPAPLGHSEFVTLEGWFVRGFDGLRRQFDGGTGPFPAGLVERAEALFRELHDSTSEVSLIHGDLHHYNILWSESHDAWLAIDPKGVVADRAYEPAPFVLNPLDLYHAVPDAGRRMKRRIDIFAEVTGIERYRIHGWTLAFTVLSAWWSYGSDHEWQRTIALGELLASP